MAVDGATTTQCLVTGLQGDTAYVAEVQCSNAFGVGPASARSSPVRTLGRPTVPVSAVRCSDCQARSVKVSWDAPAAAPSDAPTTHYTVRWAPVGGTSGATSGESKAVAANAEALETSVQGLMPATAYMFSVMPHNEVGAGVEGGSTKATTLGAPASAPSAAPRKTAASDSSVSLAWPAVVVNVATEAPLLGYDVTWRVEGAAGVASGPVSRMRVPVGGSGAAEVSAVVEGLHGDTAYAFAVAAVNDAGVGPASSTCVVTTLGAPAVAPAAPVCAAATRSSMSLKWYVPCA